MTQPVLRSALNLVGGLCVAAGVLSPAPIQAQSGPSKAKLDALIALASKESEVIYQAPDPDTGLPARDFLQEMAALTEKLYGIKVTIKIDNSINFPAATAKALTELKSGAPPSYDLMFQNAVTGIPLLQNDAYERVPWQELFPDLKPQDLAWNGITPIVDTQFILPSYNSRLVRQQDLPQSWDDLLNPKWKGKMGVLVNNEPWNLLSQPNAWGKDRAIAYLKKLMELSPKIGRMPEAHQRVLSGETPITAFGQYERVVYYRDQRNAPMGVIESVDPVLSYVFIFVVPKGARSRHAATLVAAAMMSKEGQDLHQKYRNAASMFRPGTLSSEFAKKHKVVTPQLDFMLSKDFVELNQQVSMLLSGR